MNRGQVLNDARDRLEKCGIEESAFEAEILLRYTLKTDRATFFASLDHPLSSTEYGIFQDVIGRRSGGEPTAYITGHREFYGLDFQVAPEVLIPRPETELLVETALSWCADYGYRTVADIGTGSGAIAVSLAVNDPGLTLIATDISPKALEIARENSRRHDVENRISFQQGDLFSALAQPVDLVCANLPYVPRPELVPGGILRFEPETALDGGPEGTDVLLEFCRRAPFYIKPGGGLLMEIGFGQSPVITAALQDGFPTATVYLAKDLAGIERLVCCRLV